jgi:biopolymer transport protein ExbB/TolQ
MAHLFEILNAGGIFMYGILAVSIFSVGLILHRFWSLWLRFRLPPAELTTSLTALIGERDFSRALQMVHGSHPVERMMRAALVRADRSEKEIRRSVETCAVLELARFRRGTAALPQLSNLATLLGLLGTIHGLIISFAGMQGVDAMARQAALSKGVAVAFYNTFFGLTVATVTIVAYLFVSSRQNRDLTRMEHSVSTVVDALLCAPEGRREPQPALRATR